MKTNKEEFLELAGIVGVREAARRTGLSENTAKSWWRRRKPLGAKMERVTEETPGGGVSYRDVPIERESKRPEGCSEAEWAYCLERAGRAAVYAEKFPDHVRPGEWFVYQNPLWQWENEVKGRTVPA